MVSNNLWSNLCLNLQPILRSQVPEEIFQQLFEAQLKTLFGWTESEVTSKVPIRMGSTTKQADLVLTAPDARIVVEMKRPGLPLGSRETGQLISYMRILGIKYGLLVGSRIKIYFDDDSTNDQPVEVADIPFISANDDGVALAKVLARSAFTDSAMKEFCALRVRRIELRRELENLRNRLLAGGGAKAKEYIKTKLLEDGIDNALIDELLAEIEIKRFNPPGAVSPEAKDLGDGEISMISGIGATSEKVGELANRTLRRILASGRVDDNEITRLQMKDYSKEVFNINWPLLVRSTSEFDRARYYKVPLIINGVDFRMCSQWFAKDKAFLLKWISKFETPDELSTLDQEL
ncbi:MAG: type I restriction enzyme HsdR N-terminal domain-containing protein [Promicromonosporaceae bacterium]|nr:type I restriction enzyme HsdR N-terminal domain-containing protein [Promicromonosporaceae bacterium]